jgi:ABC-type dipeptide/oligopeptide/nickel transport system ATPase component
MKPLLEVDGLRVCFHTERNVSALDGVSLEIEKGETVGLVGETGSGKSTLAFAILRLLPRHAEILDGDLLFEGTSLLRLSETNMNRIRGAKISMIFQDPRGYLNPLMTIGQQVAEAIKLHQEAKEENAGRQAIDALRSTAIPSPEVIANYYPHQLSGGMCQRAIIATAISCNPSLLIADEPTSALDVTVQAQVIDLLRDIVTKRQLSLLLITHDLGVVAQICEKVYVIRKGRIVESGPLRTVFEMPSHSYTRQMVDAYFSLSCGRDKKRQR